jgi:2-polyprenyl-6-hydroxyphenyl methylase/3-demethylubiquinone-9 3-methyltransferase
LNRDQGNQQKIIEKQFFYENYLSNGAWDDFTNNYETSRRLELIFQRLIKPSELAGKSLLDAGSGGGHFSGAASDLGARTFSLDVGLRLLKAVSQRCDSQKVAASILALPFKKTVFDIVLSTEVVEHTAAPLVAVDELAQLVKPGGLLIITTPSRLWNPVVKLATILKLRPHEGNENFLWPNEIIRSLKKQGFGIENLIGFNFCPVFTPKIDALFRFFDKAYGNRFPWLMVNFAARARKL